MVGLTSARESRTLNSEPSHRRVWLRPRDEPIGVVETLLGRLAAGELEAAYGLVAPSSKKKGAPIAYRAKLDYRSFLREVQSQFSDAGEDPYPKFRQYKLGKHRWQTKTCFRIWIHFQGGDNDEAMVVREQGAWYVADPMHIIR